MDRFVEIWLFQFLRATYSFNFAPKEHFKMISFKNVIAQLRNISENSKRFEKVNLFV